MPPALHNWVEAQVAQGRYSDAGDYLRDLVRRDQDTAREDRAWLRAMIAEGLASGMLDEEPEAIIEQIIAENSVPDA